MAYTSRHRLLVLCTHNSARSQMMEGWLRQYLPEAEVWSAGTEKTRVRPEALAVMAEVGVDLSGHYSKSLFEVPDPWDFDLVLTVCDEAAAACPDYPAGTVRRHVSIPDPSGKPLHEWRRVRETLRALAEALAADRPDWPEDRELKEAATIARPLE
jgi:arsenate reductase